MRVLYDTSSVHPLDRFSYFREAVAGGFAPVAVPGRPPRQFSAARAVCQIGDVTIETSAWVVGGMIEARRTDRLIRAGDPDCLRLLTGVHGECGLALLDQPDRALWRSRRLRSSDCWARSARSLSNTDESPEWYRRGGQP
jgi:hypothetical protein